MLLKTGHLAFGDFVLDPDEKTLTQAGEPVLLTPKALQLLLVLAENAGRIVEKGDLIDRVWPGAFVEDGNLAYTVSLLRGALGDRADDPQFIETVPRRGYRFIAEIRPANALAATGTDDLLSEPAHNSQFSEHYLQGNSAVPDADPTAGGRVAEAIEAPERYRASRRPTRAQRTVLAVAAALLLISAAAAGFRYFSERSAVGIRSVAVLPFVNASGTGEADYLSEGISESLINSLAGIRQIRVVARATAFSYKDRGLDPQTVGRQLNVDAVLSGRVTEFGDTLAVQVDLVDVRSGSQIWGERYTRNLADLSAIPQSISREIVSRVQPKLDIELEKQFDGRFPIDSEAYRLDLKGRFFWNRRTEEGLRKGVEYFEQAIAADPGYALSYVGLADTFNVMGFYSFLKPADSFPKAKAAAGKALEIDSDLAEAYNSLAYATLYFDWDVGAAEKGFLRAIELKPNYSVAHQWYGNLLTASGRWDEALRSFRRAQELDPLSPVITAVPAWTFYYSRRYDEAIEPCKKAIELDPNFALAHVWLGQAYERQGDRDRAVAEFQEALRISPGATEVTALLAHAYAVSGRSAQARAILDDLLVRSRERYVSPYHIATVYAALGESDAAIKWLETSLSDRQHVLIFLDHDARMDGLRSDPRFADLLRRRGLPR